MSEWWRVHVCGDGREYRCRYCNAVVYIIRGDAAAWEIHDYAAYVADAQRLHSCLPMLVHHTLTSGTVNA